jgi:hypothetical protein
MAECDAAVILFTPDALRSDWVRKEAAILCWRKRLQPDFKLLGLLFDHVEPKDIDKDSLYRVLRVTDLQLERDCADVGQAVDLVGDHVGRPDIANATPFDNLTDAISSILTATGITERNLQRAYRRLPGDAKPPGPPDFSFADAFARYLLRDPAKALDHLHELLKQLVVVLDRSESEQLRRLVMGLWVDAESATCLANAWHSRKVLAVNGRYTPRFSAQASCEKAWPAPTPNRFVPILAGQWRVEEIEKDLLARFEDPQTEYDDFYTPEDELRDFDGPVFLLLALSNPGQPPDPSLIRQLLDKYDNLIPVIWYEPELPEQLPPGIESIRPGFNLDNEQRQYDTFKKINTLIKSRAQQ